MLTLIAESKQMSESLLPQSGEQLAHHTPHFLSEAEEIAASLDSYSPEQLAEIVKISPRYAARLKRLLYDFPLRHTGLRALKAFTGVAFRSADFESLPDEELKNVEKNLLIVSSLYGLLRPDDIIKPYRLNFNTRIPKYDKQMSAYWRPKTTVALIKTLQERNENAVLMLLPADAFLCFDKKLLRHFAGVTTIDFKMRTSSGDLTTPPADLLKQMRGKMSVIASSPEYKTEDDLKTIYTDDFSYHSSPFAGQLIFTAGDF